MDITSYRAVLVSILHFKKFRTSDKHIFNNRLNYTGYGIYGDIYRIILMIQIVISQQKNQKKSYF